MARAYSRVLWRPGREEGFKLSMKRDGRGGPVELALRVGGFFAGHASMKDLKESMTRQREREKREILALAKGRKGRKGRSVAAGGIVRGDTGREHEKRSAVPGPSAPPRAAEAVRVGRRRRRPNPCVVESDEDGDEPSPPRNPVSAAVFSPMAPLSCCPPAGPGAVAGIVEGSTGAFFLGKERPDTASGDQRKKTKEQHRVRSASGSGEQRKQKENAQHSVPLAPGSGEQRKRNENAQHSVSLAPGSGEQSKQKKKQHLRVRFDPNLVQGPSVPHAGGNVNEPQIRCENGIPIKEVLTICPPQQLLEKDRITKPMEEKMIDDERTPQWLGSHILKSQRLTAQAMQPRGLATDDVAGWEEEGEENTCEKLKAACESDLSLRERDLSMREILVQCPSTHSSLVNMTLPLTKCKDLEVAIVEGESPQPLHVRLPQLKRSYVDPSLRVTQLLKRKRCRRH